ncbi:MAG: nickel-dependent hydrogenase large subunit [Actinomycetota bacterium]
MAQKITIDPITRIEGHLKIEVEVEDGKVKEAYSTAAMARGFEQLLIGKDPRDAQIVTQRICGVCPASHGLAAAQNLDKAFEAKVPDNARIIRNLIVGSNYVMSHILHFYHLAALDYLDVMAIAKYTGKDPRLLAVKDKIVGLVEAEDTYPLTPRYDPDEFSVDDPEIVTTAVAHYLEALEKRKKAQEMLTIFGGKMPCYCTLVPGGVTIHPTPDMIAAFKYHLMDLIDFVNNVYLADVLAFGTGPLLPIHQLKVGAGVGNFLSFGMFDLGVSGDYKNRFLKSGVIMDGKLEEVGEFDPTKIEEAVKYSWYTEDCGGLHPTEGKTEYDLDKEGAYSFAKAPRYDGKPVEVNTLARMLITQDKGFMDLVNKIGAHPSAVARHAARAWECKMVAEAMLDWLDELVDNLKAGNTDICDDKPVPEKGKGIGMVEAPRGCLLHCVQIEGKKIKRYQVIAATNWNVCPRDDKGQRGPIEEALVGTPVPDPNNPINVVRVVRSFDP